jgi:flagellar basal-body rod modification protein FlgD
MEISTLAAQTPQASGALARLSGDLNSFLTLLTTQLKHQDPLDPLDTEKFTSQLVEFASVEQAIETNKHLELLIGLQSAADRDGAIAMIGRTLMIAGDRAFNGGAGARWSYELAAPAATVRLTVVDAAGAPVATFAGAAAAGLHDVGWDGKIASGGVAPAGVYRLVVDARDAQGAPLPVAVTSAVTADAVVFTAAGPQLETAVGPTPLALVRRVLGS